MFGPSQISISSGPRGRRSGVQLLLLMAFLLAAAAPDSVANGRSGYSTRSTVEKWHAGRFSIGMR